MMSNVSENQTKLQVFLLKEAKNLFPLRKRLLGIDYGMKRIGLSLSDKDGLIAEPFKIIHQLKELDDIIPAKEIEAIVIGLPLQTDGTEGEIAKSVHLFANRVSEKYNLPVFLIDERYTSKYATEYLNSLCMREEKQRKILDAYAAARILQKAIDEVNK